MAAPMRLARFLAKKANFQRFTGSRVIFTSASINYDKSTPSEPKSGEEIATDSPKSADNVRTSDDSVPVGSDPAKSSREAGLDKVFDMFKRVETGGEVAPGEHAHPVASRPRKNESFATMLRKSKLMELGDPDGRVLIGTVVETMEDDLYIDFGGKFNCVCKRPRMRPSEYQRGTQVRIRLHDLELASLFMGAKRDITLLEADATLLGLFRTSTSPTSKSRNEGSSRKFSDV